jgi:hypothetical protein
MRISILTGLPGRGGSTALDAHRSAGLPPGRVVVFRCTISGARASPTPAAEGFGLHRQFFLEPIPLGTHVVDVGEYPGQQCFGRQSQSSRG